ncbi:MAG TPA: DNA helicase RecQ [Methylomirabilota bacterium]|nr:DNA helicase RecQ [Methylomirabilota bacterium]
MRVLIVAKTRRGGGACVGGVTLEGRSVRLVFAGALAGDHAGLEYEVGEVWEIESSPDPHIVPPHVENILVYSGRRLKRVRDAGEIIRRLMPSVMGGPDPLFDGLLQALPSGCLYIAERTGIPSRSTLFWVPDQPLERDTDARRIRYRYPTEDGGRTLTFVGFQEPVEVIPAGTLLRVSLAHWWRPPERPDEELRCHGQLSGWFLEEKPLPGAAPGSGHQPFQQPRAEPAPVPELATARALLKQVFGFAEFLPQQHAVVTRILQRRDTLVILPTGGGKSLCYQLPALLLDGLTVVVSPLIALMQDQVHQLHELAVRAAFLNSSLSHREYLSAARNVRGGEARILYVAPETLLRPETLLLLEESRLACLAVDEAHCISEWGHDFRPEYRQLEQVRQRFPEAVCVALTATATPRVRRDIRRLLGIEAAGEITGSFNRPNLFLGVQARSDGLGQTLTFLEQHRGQAGIVYCSTRKQVDQLAAELAARDWPVLPYHAGLDSESRRRNQERFIHDDDVVMVATIAFGMGINKSNVRFILHYNLPRDLEGYYQEIGRAGRDGLPADCLLLHSRADAVTIRRFIDQGADSERSGRQARLEAMIRYAEAAGCRRIPLLAYFGEAHEGGCGQCDRCRAGDGRTDQVDVTEAARNFLTCVERTGESFGPVRIIDVLRGSRSQRVLSRGHDRLPVHGVGREFSVREWRELAKQFIEQGLVKQDLEFGGLRLSGRARAVLNGERVFVRRGREPAGVRTGSDSQATHDSGLFELLRRKRRELADQGGLPAYIIFSDRTLVEMARRLPRTAEEFLAINGVGEARLANYGEGFLEVIRAHGASRHSGGSATVGGSETQPTRLKTVRRRCEEIGEAFTVGETIDQLAARFGVKRGTILQHLEQHVVSGGRLDAGRVLAASALPVEQRAPVLALFKRHGLDRLAPVFEELGGRVAYDELRLLRIWFRCGEAGSRNSTLAKSRPLIEGM